MVSALIFIAHGTEEMEFTIVYDTLIIADTTLASLLSSTPETVADLLVVPGGAKGAETISQNEEVQKMIRAQVEAGRFVGMICAGSLAAKTSGLGKKEKLPLTSHPSVKAELDTEFDYQEDPVVTSGKVITSRGPGTAFPFSLTLVEKLLGPEKREEVQSPMIFPSGAI
ncbi:DJ-1 [Pyrrhoderma noxium]|uniref:D-lactate dehydratase n=1 Tax=Pyrrhoderma noxium TaxID=2282107 RepID=A0A286ULJ9_9AGAM|nr:DJ-1 [Pyrrhoderma noxium]